MVDMSALSVISLRMTKQALHVRHVGFGFQHVKGD